MGRAALVLAQQGIRVVFGNEVCDDHFLGFEARPGAWRAVQTPDVALFFDRFTSHRPTAYYDNLRAVLGPIPIANGLVMNTLCRDKLACQRVLEAAGLPIPPVAEHPHDFERRLAEWGEGFLKPRYGQCGDGVRSVRSGMRLQATSGREVDGIAEPNILQRAVRPPPGWAGVSVRVLTQRAPGGAWVTNPAVVRRSVTDPVANVSRGAEAVPAMDVLSQSQCQQIDALARAACDALAAQPGGEWFIDAGVDLVIGADGAAQLIEVNSRPWGRVKALARRWPERFKHAHDVACERPLMYLSWRLLHGNKMA